MKKIILILFKWFTTAKKEFKDLPLKDKKTIILDQLFFDIDTVDTLQLLDEINKESRIRLEIQKKKSLEIAEAITQHFSEEITE
jgi:hypothetical protein